jgi:hypothetical protein
MGKRWVQCRGGHPGKLLLGGGHAVWRPFPTACPDLLSAWVVNKHQQSWAPAALSDAPHESDDPYGKPRICKTCASGFRSFRAQADRGIVSGQVTQSMVCAGAPTSANTANAGASARHAGAPPSASTADGGASAGTAGAPPCASTADGGAGAGTAGAPPCASTADRGASAGTAGAPPCASTADRGAGARHAAAPLNQLNFSGLLPRDGSRPDRRLLRSTICLGNIAELAHVQSDAALRMGRCDPCGNADSLVLQ